MSENMKAKAIRAYKDNFGEPGGGKLFFAPGRVNLIGEHTDYNGGHVFPCALTLGTYGVFKKRSDRILRFYSANEPEAGVIETSLDQLIPGRSREWTAYPEGVVFTMLSHGYQVNTGFDMAICGDLPGGAGLSSSASLDVLTAFAVRELFGLDLADQELAIFSKEADNSYCGINCGIMDQFTVAMGRKDHAIYLDTSDLSYEYVPLKLDGMKIVISNTNKKHSLVDSQYNQRWNECRQALTELQAVVDIENLCDLSPEEFEKYKGAISDPVIRRRAKHAVYEDARCRAAVKVLKAGDIRSFGRLMNEAHISVSRDYEVTGPELDTLQEEALKVPGVIGSRMTGGGFGGCTVSIVEEGAIDDFREKVGEAYLKKIGYPADFYVVEAGDGPALLEVLS